MTLQAHTAVFESNRPRLLGLAYRMLGSRADAEDAVQDTFLKWQQADQGTIENMGGWLTAICTNRCIDMLRASHRARVDYVGTWLPEPTPTSPFTPETERDLMLSSSLTTAFLLMLERLTPKERAAYLLHDIFEQDYAEIAATLAMDEAACRKLVSRAREHIQQTKVRHATAREQQDKLLATFQDAVETGSTERLAALLSDDIALHADGGGKATAASRVLTGKKEVMQFIERVLMPHYRQYDWTFTDLNGGPGLVLRHNNVAVVSMSFATDTDGRTTDIYVMRNPDKLGRLDITPLQ
ncbi:MAG: RNA polymerase sigma factor SigJ [Rhodospirillaceae bacterium]|nr:RNA polymerase sigma factor SigJ [Rhodospirillaceae bacterium]